LPGELALHFNNNKKKNLRRERKKIPEFFRWKKKLLIGREYNQIFIT
jgi:hypothetical protein